MLDTKMEKGQLAYFVMKRNSSKASETKPSKCSFYYDGNLFVWKMPGLEKQINLQTSSQNLPFLKHYVKLAMSEHQVERMDINLIIYIYLEDNWC